MRVSAAVLLVLLAALPAASVDNFAAPPATSEAPASPVAVEDLDLVKLKVEELTLREKVSQLMFVTFQGLYGPNNEDRALMAQYTPGGVLISATVKPGLAADYVKALRALNAERKFGIPLFIAADVYRLTQHGDGTLSTFLQLPSPMAVAAAGDEESTRRLGSLIAESLELMGFNMNMGPRLELAPDVEGVRGTVYTFGSDPAFAAKAGATITEVLIENGLLVMPTGFPGGGGNRGPKRPGALLTPRPHYIERDGLPFRKAIESGAPLMLVSNTLVPTLAKASAPASLSTSVMRGLLRGEMGFDGVVVAGPMDSPEITRLHTPTDAALLAFEAGTDMIFWNAPGPHVMKAVELIVLAVNKGRVKEADIDKALTRVLELKRSHNLLEHPMPDTRKAAALEKKRKNFDDAYLIERRSVTVVSNRGGVLPLTNTTASVPLGVTGVAGVEELYDVLRKHLKPVAQQPIMTASHLGRIEDFEIYRLTSHVEGMKTAVCVLTDMRSVEGQVTLIRELHAKGVRVVIVLLGYPHNLAHLREADAIVVAYCDDSTDCAATMKAVGEALIGQGPVRILEVERDLPVTVGKAETFDIANIVWTPPGRLPVTIDEPFVAGYAVPMNPAPAAKKVEWDFGDGKRAKGAQAEHTYATPGRYTLGLTVTDHHGDVTSGTFSIVAE